jgi:hypothetical protein
MRTLISKHKLLDKIKKLGYESFCDENCVLIPVDQLITLLAFKYCGAATTDIFGYALDGDNLICENIGGFSIIIPLIKPLKNNFKKI